MRSKAEITSKFAKAYLKAGKKDKGRILDEVVAVTILSVNWPAGRSRTPAWLW